MIKLSCPRKQHNFLARIQTWIAPSKGEGTKHEADVPPQIRTSVTTADKTGRHGDNPSATYRKHSPRYFGPIKNYEIYHLGNLENVSLRLMSGCDYKFETNL